VCQEGVLDEWFKWNLFPYSLADEAKMWYSFASFEVEGNWNKLTKKFCEKFFPISKVQHLRRQVITFTQGEEEGIDQAWNRFNELIGQGPRLGFSGDVLLNTFFFSLTPSCMQHIQMCVGGDLMEKTLTEAAKLLQKISKAAAMRRNWETRLAGEPEHNSRMKACAEISKEATLKDKKEEPIPEKLEEVHVKSRNTPSVDFAESNETNKGNMSSAKPLREFKHMDWVPINYGKVFDKRRSFPKQKRMARALEADFPPEKRAEDLYDLETTGEIFQKLFGYNEVDPEHIAEVERIMGIKPETSPYARLAEVYAIGSNQEEKMKPHLSCEINEIQCKALCDIRAQVSVLSSKIYDKVQDHNLDLAPTSTKLIMGDGRTIRPVGIACNINVIISGKCIPTDSFVIDAYHSNHDHIILGKPFFKLVDAVLDAGKGKVTINLNGNKYAYNFLRVSKHHSPFPPEDEEVEEVGSFCFVEILRAPLQRAMENQCNDQQDEELQEATKGLEPQDGSVEKEKIEEIGDIKPKEPKVPEVDLKPLPNELKYEFLGLYKTYPVIVSDELSPEENEKLLNLLKKHRKVIGYSTNGLKGLSPAFCTHRIPMEDQCKTIVDHQRRITHAM
jgi:hypothetical protein